MASGRPALLLLAVLLAHAATRVDAVKATTLSGACLTLEAGAPTCCPGSLGTPQQCPHADGVCCPGETRALDRGAPPKPPPPQA